VLIQDIPPYLTRYQREGILLVEGLETLVYVDPDLMTNEALDEEVDANDVRVTKVFVT